MASIFVKVRLRGTDEWYVPINDYTAASFGADEIEKRGHGFVRCRAHVAGPDRFIRASDIDRIEVNDDA